MMIKKRQRSREEWEVLSESILFLGLFFFLMFWVVKLVVWVFTLGFKLLSIESLIFGLNWGEVVFMGWSFLMLVVFLLKVFCATIWKDWE
jgi:hypothetical protein